MGAYSTYTDQELTALLKSGDSHALTEIHSRYYAVLYAHAYKRFPYREEVLDILQELFTYMWDHRMQLVFTTTLPGYLYAAVRNRVLNLHRSQKVRGEYAVSLQEFSEQGESITDNLIREKELLQMVEQEIAKLPTQMRIIFDLSRNEALSHNEIAKKLNLSPQTVRTQVRNALRILRVKLGANIFLIFL
ncbi:RNA polymerase sigma-70 factor [Pedobacter heparinus]|uniref:RNA polymerase sigma-70 factor n=1 Tax=Pedobacter heparinus (strain ATCC 13125 / DSM 2366 / CIP 104194 / JCM 7457 / NBRC 12017 / NCIMB 9290 / NRRL B-14731 / HIM 762-3) TaxID=485917 RepID=C6Y2D1_PEDHD|nr:RNA polymerase sigma-70 factor [Pedobacter heparinus]ACU03124.1 RNA polymerase sigma-70 factor [Pedobacter heparinus DSM 2366]